MMRIEHTYIEGVSVVTTLVHQDHRGAFLRAFCDQELSAVLQGRPIRQANLSRTESVGALRGLHYQAPPFAEMKLVRCVRGRVWDVALDLRQGSPTFLQWQAEELSASNARMLVIPEGCAHGFQVLEASSELLYLHTAPYEPGAEGGVRFDDPAVGIAWPLAVTDISQRDKSHPLLTPAYGGLAL